MKKAILNSIVWAAIKDKTGTLGLCKPVSTFRVCKEKAPSDGDDGLGVDLENVDERT